MSDYLWRHDIQTMPKRYRANFINCLSGFKGANLVGTTSANTGNDNLAVISSVVHIGANPPLLGMIIRPHSIRRDTLENIQETGAYTINHISGDIVKQAHQTSAKYEKDLSEFAETGLTPEFVQGFKAPFVKQSPIKMGMELSEILPIRQNDTLFVIGEIQCVFVPEDAISEDGFVSLASQKIACVNGLDSYLVPKHGERFGYAKPD